MDLSTGAALGIANIKYETHQEAKICLEKEAGKKFGFGGVGMIDGLRECEGEDVRLSRE